MRFEPSLLVEVDERLPHHGRQVGDDVPPLVLDAHGGAAHRRVGVHRIDKSSNAWFPSVATSGWMLIAVTIIFHWFWA